MIGRMLRNPNRAYRPRIVLAVLLLLPSPIVVSGAEPSWSNFEALDLEGKTFDGNRLEGQVVLLDFWATWCGPCIQAISTLNQLQEEFSEVGLEVVGIAAYSGTRDDVQQFVARHQPHYAIVMGDEDLVERFGVIGYPTYFLIDRQGRIAETYVGEIESILEEVVSKIRELTQN